MMDPVSYVGLLEILVVRHFKQLEEVPIRTTGKAPTNISRKQKRGANKLNWNKKNVFSLVAILINALIASQSRCDAYREKYL